MANAAAGGHNTPSIWEQSSHPVALLFLFLFRGLAIATYLLSGFFSTGFVFSVSDHAQERERARAMANPKLHRLLWLSCSSLQTSGQSKMVRPWVQTVV